MEHGKKFLKENYEIIEKLESSDSIQRFIIRDKQSKELYELTILASRFVNPAMFKQLRREIKILSEIKHPNISKIIFWDATETELTVIKSVHRGIFLPEWAMIAKRNVKKILTYMMQTYKLLAYLHANQIYHRKLSPQSFIIDDTGKINLVDAGTAYMTGLKRDTDYMDMSLTEYLAPEQLKVLYGHQYEMDTRIDLFSAAVIFFELLTEHFPFKCSGGFAKRIPQYDQKAYSVQKFLPKIPTRLSALFARLLAVPKEDRPESAAEVIDELRYILTTEIL